MNSASQRGLAILAVALVMALLLVAAREWSLTGASLRQLEWRIEDNCHLAGKLTPTDPDILVIGIDDASLSLESAFPEDVQASRPLQLIEKGWIWPREVYAHLVDRLIQAGAKKVVLDLMFATPTPDHPEYDQALRSALERHRDKVVIGADIETRLLRGSVLENLVLPASALIPPARPMDSRIGFLTYWPDGDNVVRRVRSEFGLTEDAADRLPSLPANALGPKSDRFQEFRAIRFADPSAYAPLSLHEIFVPDIWESNYLKQKVFADKIVFVGPTARHFQDSVVTPVGELFGVQVHAQVCAALKAGQFLTEVPVHWVQAGITGAALAAGLLILLLKRPLLALVVLVAGSFGGLWLQQYAFNHWDRIVPMLTPLIAWNATGIFALGWDFVLERREKLKLRSNILRYFSPDMAAEILRKPDAYLRTLGGAQKEITVLFSDLRGFTSLSEKCAPDQLVQQLNQYLERMVEITFGRKGSIDKFIGDAIMAVWGRIRDEADDKALEEDACLAVETALKMREGLDDLNRQWAKAGQPALAIGIGIHQGSAIVGNMGSPAKMEFTAIGDSVNLSARLESATKQYGVDIIISQPVWEKAQSHFICRSADLVVVKGKKVPVQVYSVLSSSKEPPPAGLSEFEDGITAFRAGHFMQAQAHFKAAAIAGLDDELTQLYQHRCDKLIANPPTDWEGIWVLKDK